MDEDGWSSSFWKNLSSTKTEVGLGTDWSAKATHLTHQQDPLSPTDAEALMAVVLSSAHQITKDPDVWSFKWVLIGFHQFWISAGWFQISNFGENHSTPKIFKCHTWHCQNSWRWGLQNSLKPGNKAFSLPLGRAVSHGSYPLLPLFFKDQE